ncbi:hypothetical protein H8K52_14210 [Undibacterium seohonense]|uniref:HNH endonuclease n=1 Tax=Undibacterium seohonense TaxID=1344950 RepID=A0ABR6X6H0_9BURK|nr:hypothetical protein [Undibacterium seohonense]MBC3808494.1 hypothetical protein [Undibacterium seohonense]
MTLTEIENYFRHVLPRKDDQVFFLSQLLESVSLAREYSGAWSTTMLSDGFRLNVGQVEALSCTFKKVESAQKSCCQIELRILLAGDDCDLVFNLNPEFESMVAMNYASIGQSHWCYSFLFDALPSMSLESILNEVGGQIKRMAGLRRQYIDRASHTSIGKVRNKSNFAASHCPTLIEYAELICKVENKSTDGWYNGYSWKEREARLKEAHRLQKLGLLQHASGPCQLCGDPNAEVKYHDEDYSLPYLWGGIAAYALCLHCHIHKLHRRFSNRQLWLDFLAHVRRGGYASDLKNKKISKEFSQYRKAVASGEVFTLVSLRPYAQEIGQEWFSKLSTDPSSLRDPSARPRP